MGKVNRLMSFLAWVVIPVVAALIFTAVSISASGSKRARRQDFYGDISLSGEVDGNPSRLVDDGQMGPSEDCEESPCGQNVRHCPYGCTFNSFNCTDDGVTYDQCCCY